MLGTIVVAFQDKRNLDAAAYEVMIQESPAMNIHQVQVPHSGEDSEAIHYVGRLSDCYSTVDAYERYVHCQ